MRSTLLLLPLLALAACQSSPDEVDVYVPEGADVAIASSSAGVVTVGEPLASDLTYLPASEVVTRAAELDGQTVAVEGEVSSVCQEAGCWLTVKNDADETFRVNVPKDAEGAYVYTFPMDVAGAQARLVGTLAVEEESVETQRHLAEDAGADAAAIEAITEPKRSITLTPTGAQITRA